jgi:hypothetical protein
MPRAARLTYARGGRSRAWPASPPLSPPVGRADKAASAAALPRQTARHGVVRATLVPGSRPALLWRCALCLRRRDRATAGGPLAP